MNVFLGLGIFYFFFLSCDSKKTRPVRKNSSQPKKEIFIKQSHRIKKSPLLDSIIKVNKNFKNLVQNFEDSIYTLDLLKDKTKQNMSYIHPLILRRRQSLLDTPAIKSRLVLTNVHIKKLNYLLNKKNINLDSINRTLNRIILDLNNVIDIAEKYNHKKDEFLEILQYDSIMHDTINKKNLDNNPIKKSILNLPQKTH